MACCAADVFCYVLIVCSSLQASQEKLNPVTRVCRCQWLWQHMIAFGGELYFSLWNNGLSPLWSQNTVNTSIFDIFRAKITPPWGAVLFFFWGGIYTKISKYMMTQLCAHPPSDGPIGGQRDMSPLNDVTFRQNELSWHVRSHIYYLPLSGPHSTECLIYLVKHGIALINPLSPCDLVDVQVYPEVDSTDSFFGDSLSTDTPHIVVWL